MARVVVNDGSAGVHRRRALVWRVRVLMAEHGIKTVTELGKLLAKVGVSVSVAQLGRLIDGKSVLWNQAVIEGLMETFDCDLSDLLQVEVHAEA